MRRIMFESEFSEKCTKQLDEICFTFLRNVNIFDEILLVKWVSSDYLTPLYDFSYRDIKLDNIKKEEMNNLEIFASTIENNKWNLIHTADGTNFDIIGKIFQNIFVLINNTKMDFNEVKKTHGEKYVDTFSPMIDIFIDEISFLFEKDIHFYK